MPLEGTNTTPIDGWKKYHRLVQAVGGCALRRRALEPHPVGWKKHRAQRQAGGRRP